MVRDAGDWGGIGPGVWPTPAAVVQLEGVFWVNVPMAATAILLASPGGRADPVGLAYSAIGLTALVWSIIEGPTKGWPSGPILAAALALAVFGRWERRYVHPRLPWHFFASCRFSIATRSLGGAYFGLIGALFVYPVPAVRAGRRALAD